MVDDENNFYIDHNERLGTVMEVREDVEDVITVTSDVDIWDLDTKWTINNKLATYY